MMHHPRTGMTIAVDVGGTGIKGGIVDPTGTILLEREIRTPSGKEGASILDALIEFIEAFISQAEGSISAIGVCSAGRIDPATGSVIAAANLPGWAGSPVADHLKKAFKLPVVVENDVNAAAVGEAWIGAAMRVPTFSFIALGTGIGGAIMHQGSLLHGVDGGAGEVGHLILRPGGHPCGCGQHGCLEQYASGTALNREARMIDGGWTSRILFEQALQGEERAERVVGAFADDLAIGLINVYQLTGTKLIVLGGGLIDNTSAWWDTLENSIRQHTSKPIELVPARLGNKAGIIGAAILAMQRKG